MDAVLADVGADLRHAVCRFAVRWSHLFGQLGSEIKVYSSS